MIAKLPVDRDAVEVDKGIAEDDITQSTQVLGKDDAGHLV
jgi:hypothetical protein